MDWQSVSVGELCDALKEVDWKAPRPVPEFFQRFSLPKNFGKWTSRLKCNVYYYRTNYAVIFILSLMACFMRNPRALLAVMAMALAVLCLNDPFATSLNDTLLRMLKKINTRAALRLRAKATQADGNLGIKRRGKRSMYIIGFPRGVFVLLLVASGLFIMYMCRGWVTLAWGFLFGLGLPLLHATFRSPNLKARLASAREEFRAVWRGYQADMHHDYTM